MYITHFSKMMGMNIRKEQHPKSITPRNSVTIGVIAQNIRRLRHAKLISQEYLAELCDLHRNYIGQIERSEVNVSIITLESIAKALDTHISNLIDPIK